MSSSVAGASRIILATRNAHKVAELREILAEALPTIDVANRVVAVHEVPELDQLPEVRETGVTFEANALLKAHQIALATGEIAIADDSGISVDILGGAPGIFSARWSGAHGRDAENTELLLAQLQDIAEPYRAARFVCAAAAVFQGNEVVFRGEVLGALAAEPRGEHGFGYDPIFVPQDSTEYPFQIAGRTMAELTAAEKNHISHRRRAFAALAEELSQRGI